MDELRERAVYAVALGFGRLLRAGRYSRVRIVVVDGEHQVHKRRLFHAPLLVAMGGPLVRFLGTGVRVLPAQEWLDRERRIYRSMYSSTVTVDGDVVVLPCLPGETLAALLEDRELDASLRRLAIKLAVAALAGFHRHGFTHGDAMAENVMVDLAAGTAHWFDFETVHDVDRAMSWRRADDVRALLATCLLRTRPTEFASTLDLILDGYGGDVVTPILAANFASGMRRPLVFHLGQAPLSYQHFRGIGRLLHERTTTVPRTTTAPRSTTTVERDRNGDRTRETRYDATSS